MKRTQIQLPETLYKEAKRVARLNEWSIAEIIRRGLEKIITSYPEYKTKDEDWKVPTQSDLGEFLVDHQKWRELVTEDEEGRSL